MLYLVFANYRLSSLIWLSSLWNALLSGFHKVHIISGFMILSSIHMYVFYYYSFPQSYFCCLYIFLCFLDEVYDFADHFCQKSYTYMITVLRMFSGLLNVLHVHRWISQFFFIFCFRLSHRALISLLCWKKFWWDKFILAIIIIVLNIIQILMNFRCYTLKIFFVICLGSKLGQIYSHNCHFFSW